MNPRSASAPRLSTIASVAGILALGLAGTAAHAQTYVGGAYDVGIGLIGLGIGVNSVALPSAGSANPIQATVLNVNANLGGLGSLLGANVTAPTVNVSTTGNGGTITSTSLLSGVTIPLLEVLGTGTQLYVSALGSTTTADYGTGIATGSSTIANLYLQTTLLGSVTSSVALNISGASNQSLDLGIPGIADVVLNQQIWDAGHDALTTNALAVDVLGQTADVTVGSSTAGFTGHTLGSAAAAPEPGSLPLIAAGIPFLLGGIGVGRRKLARRRGNAA